MIHHRGPLQARIIGTGITSIGKIQRKTTDLMQTALERALANARINLHELDGLIAIPSLSDPHFMEGHFLGTRIGLLPQKNVIVRTIDTGGAGPVSGLLEATRFIKTSSAEIVAVVAGDAVSSLSREEFLKRADQTCQNPDKSLPSPVIPNGYDRVAQWQMQTYGVKREQLAMCSVLMSIHASKHPLAMTKTPHTLERVLSSTPVGPVTSTLECARRADGAAAIIVASSRFLNRSMRYNEGIVVLGGGEASGPLYPPPVIDETMFSCEEATAFAYEEAQLGVKDINFFGLYDCFPICLIRAIEAVGLCNKGEGGNFIEKIYKKYVSTGRLDPDEFPINTHGGLLAFGAPWEAPAMFNITEAVAQLNKQASRRQITNCKRALVYGNGGIFSASAVAILGDGRY